MEVIIAHPGTQHAYHLAGQLQLRAQLGTLHTGLAFCSGTIFDRLHRTLPVSRQGRLGSRRIHGLERSKLRTYPLGELLALGLMHVAGATEPVLHWRNQRFQESVPDRFLRQANVVVGYDTSSWILARRVKGLGGKFVLDQSIGHPVVKERTFAVLRERYPAWKITVRRKLPEHIAEESIEHALADLVVAPSQFVKETLTAGGVPAEKIRIVRFGTDLAVFRPAFRPPIGKPVVFLFVGSISARKGVPVLFEAWRQMKARNAELWLVGSGVVPNAERHGLPSTVRLLGPRSRTEVAELMRTADVFTFPSFFEGLAQVQVEALATGLPVVATPESGARDLVREGENGFLVPAGDASSLADRMDQLAADPALRAKMRNTAIRERDRLSWDVYGERWCEVLEELSLC